MEKVRKKQEIRDRKDNERKLVEDAARLIEEAKQKEVDARLEGEK